MKTVVSVVGTRPNFVKLAALSPELRRHFKEIIIHTGQHYSRDMFTDFFEDLNIPKPDYNLGVVGETQGEQIGNMLIQLDSTLRSLQETEHIKAVLVYGDTNSTLAGALMAKRLGIPVVHVEAGLRSYDMRMPEEQNRLIIDRIADICFCPTNASCMNLVLDRGGSAGIFCKGDVHASLFKKVYVPIRKKKKASHILCTIHRAENSDSEQRMCQIITALKKLGEEHTVIFPVHPRTRKNIMRFTNSRMFELCNDIYIEAPAGYLKMMELIDQASVVVTDSGGIQKEAYFCSTPCITVRDSTEWKETTKGRWNRLVPAQSGLILAAVADVLDLWKKDKRKGWQGPEQDRTLFGLDRNPAAEIAATLENLL